MKKFKSKYDLLIINMKVEKGINVVSGSFLIIFILGSMFSRHILRYGYFMILAFALLMFHFYLSVLRNNLKGKTFGKYMGIVGFVGVALIFLFFGMQSPQVPFRNYFLAFGLIIILYGLWGWFRE